MTGPDESGRDKVAAESSSHTLLLFCRSHSTQWSSVIHWVTWMLLSSINSSCSCGLCFCAARIHPQIPPSAFDCLQMLVENDLPIILREWDSPSLVSNIFSKIFFISLKPNSHALYTFWVTYFLRLVYRMFIEPHIYSKLKTNLDLVIPMFVIFEVRESNVRDFRSSWFQCSWFLKFVTVLSVPNYSRTLTVTDATYYFTLYILYFSVITQHT